MLMRKQAKHTYQELQFTYRNPHLVTITYFAKLAANSNQGLPAFVSANTNQNNISITFSMSYLNLAT